MVTLNKATCERKSLTSHIKAIIGKIEETPQQYENCAQTNFYKIVLYLYIWNFITSTVRNRVTKIRKMYDQGVLCYELERHYGKPPKSK